MPLEVYNLSFDSRLAYSCASLWLYLFGIFILAVEATNGIFMLMLLTGPVVTYYVIKKLAIPQPPEVLVKEILGREIKPEAETTIEGLSNGCSLPEEETGEVYMPVIAHRFAGLDAPENSIEALELCYQNGAIGAEFDLVLTKDLVPIIFHDVELNRMTEATGEIQEKTWQELKQLDISVNHPFHEKFRGTKIALFDDVIQKVLEYDMRIFIDIKDDRPEIINIILEAFKKHPKLYKRTIVSSFNFWIVYGVRHKDPGIVISMAWRPHYMSYCKYSVVADECIPYSKSPVFYYWGRFLDHITTWFFYNLASHLCGFSAVLICKDVITPELVNYWKLRNVRVIAWTVNSPLEKLHLVRNLGIAYMTDSMLGN